MAAGGLADSASTRKGDGMAGGPPAAVRPAATVVLHRPGPSGLEVFWVRRGEQLRFAGGFYAFPGGRVDVGDAALPMRFDARFYLAELPAGETAEVWPGELVDGEWVRPETALRRWEEGSALLHPPAWHTLRSLAMGLPAAVPLLQDPSRAPWGLP